MNVLMILNSEVMISCRSFSFMGLCPAVQDDVRPADFYVEEGVRVSFREWRGDGDAVGCGAVTVFLIRDDLPDLVELQTMFYHNIFCRCFWYISFVVVETIERVVLFHIIYDE